ncbi:MAG TPA: hypothetical protein VEH27_19570, partial [Methylomirabilota bacterium]|nr:hypothetical protein [Methylomirabilota bacterium]
ANDANPHTHAKLNPGRRLVLFGPEGFREAPRDHRLVIVMGADPSGYFEAIDSALGDMAQVQVVTGNTAVKNEMLNLYEEISTSSKRLEASLAEAKAQLQP